MVLTTLALLIALPTIYFSLNGENKRIRGLDPADLNKSFITSEFSFQPSTDFQEGSVYTFTVDLSSIPAGERQAQFERIRNIVYYRLSRVNLSHYQLDSLIDHGLNNFALRIKVPVQEDQASLELLTSRGELSVWIDDPTAEIDTKDATTNVFAGRIESGLTNEDVASVGVVSDARIYLYSPETPSNYGLKVVFNEGAAQKFVNAVLSSTSKPMIYAIDGVPLGVQAPGQVFNPANIGTEALVATLSNDTYYANSIIGALLSSPAIDFPLTLSDISTVSPVYGEQSLSLLKVAPLVSVVIVLSVIVFYFRKRSAFMVVSFAAFIVWAIALMKMFNVSLSLATYAGFMASAASLLVFLALLGYRIRTEFQSGLTSEELKEAYTRSFANFLTFTVASLLISVIMQYYSVLFFVHFSSGYGFGIVAALGIMFLFVRSVLPFTFEIKARK